MTLPQENKWTVESRSWPTGGDDYDGCWELTNGKIGICTKDDDDIVDEGLKEAAEALNKTKATFYQMEGERELNLLTENAELYNKIGVLKEQSLEREKVLVDALEEGIQHYKWYKEKLMLVWPEMKTELEKDSPWETKAKQALASYRGEKEVGNG
jgi:hypothetical protein